MVAPKFIRKRIIAVKRWRKRYLPIFLLAAGLFFVSIVSYAYYMSNQRLSANPESYKPLLSLIGKIESNDNYNAHFGNSASNVPFTSMSITDVLKWQNDFVAQGSPSSAVGRYQIINNTLEGLVSQMGLDMNQKFDETTQDAVAIKLLERRGSVEYINQELTKEQFAASLAKEWAALPKVIGENPDQSYYAGDGLNKSRIAPDDVLNAIEPIEAK